MSEFKELIEDIAMYEMMVKDGIKVVNFMKNNMDISEEDFYNLYKSKSRDNVYHIQTIGGSIHCRRNDIVMEYCKSVSKSRLLNDTSCIIDPNERLKFKNIFKVVYNKYNNLLEDNLKLLEILNKRKYF